MEITEVRIKLMESSEDRLRGFCSITFDDNFVVRDLKIIQGNNGPFVAMPSRKLTANCPKCRTKNHLRANFCNCCGEKLQGTGVSIDSSGRAKLYADIAHPVNARCREMIQHRIIDDLNREIELAAQPGYKSRYDEDYDDDFDANETVEAIAKSSKTPPSQSTESEKSLDRIDTGSINPSGPHEPQSAEQDASASGFPPGAEDFGKGIF